MQLQIITPEKIFFKGEAEMVTIPGALGEFGVLSGHAPFVSTLKPGVIAVDLADKSKRKIVVLSGLAEVTPEQCTVLAETAEDVTAVDVQTRLSQAKKAAADAVTEDEKKKAAHQLAIVELFANSAQ